MTKFLRAIVGTGVALAIVLGPAAVSARATFNTAPGSPHQISYKAFVNSGFAAVTPIHSVAFNTGGKHPLTGTILSRVFKTGSTYAYLYQVQIANVSPNAGKTLNTFTIAPFKTNFASFKIGKDMQPVFQIIELGKGQSNTSGFFMPSSTIGYGSVKGTDGSSLVANFPTSGNGSLRRGTTSAILVVFSTKQPGTVLGNLHGIPNNSTTGTVDGGVYVPAPEPASLTMLALGGAGLAGVPLWRRRRAMKLSQRSRDVSASDRGSRVAAEDHSRAPLPSSRRAVERVATTATFRQGLDSCETGP
jgi:hypothetical protein